MAKKRTKMNLPSHIKSYSKFLNRFYPKGFTSIPIKIIFLNRSIYNDLKTVNPKPENIAILKHEETHLKRAVEIGVLKHSLKYLLFPKFRLNEELLAYKEHFKYLKQNNLNCDIESVARKISGIMYLHATSYENAKRLLNETWSRA